LKNIQSLSHCLLLLQAALAEEAAQLSQVSGPCTRPEVAAAAWHLMRKSDSDDGAMAEFAGTAVYYVV